MTYLKDIARYKFPSYDFIRLTWRRLRLLGPLKTINLKKNGNVQILGLSNEEIDKIISLERLTRHRHPDEYQQLLEIAYDVGVAHQYDEFAVQNPDILKEEHAWLVTLIRQAISETGDENPWAVLYLTIAYKVVLSRKIEHRLNPKTDIVLPSAFVYAMQ